MHLEVKNIRFPGDALYGDWLGTDYIVNILYLTIIDPIIYDIHPGAFNLNVFENVTSINIIGFRIEYIRDGIFKCMINLSQIRFENVSLKKIDFKHFQMNKLIESIQILNSTDYEMEIINENRNTELKRLNHLIVNDINLANKLRRNSFYALIGIEILNLKNNQISYLPDGIFDRISNDRVVIYLSGNHLKSVSDLAFETMLSNAIGDVKIYLRDNQWHCDENIVDLINLMKKCKTKFDSPSCVTPETLKGAKLTRLNIRRTTTTTATTRRPPTKTSSTISPTNNYKIPIKCIKILSANIDINIIYILKRNYSIKIINDKKIQIILKIFPKNMTIIWMERENESLLSFRYGCFMNNNDQTIQDMIIIDGNFHFNKIYSICVISKNGRKNQPINCWSFKIEQEICNNLSILNQYKWWCLCGVILIGFIIGCFSFGSVLYLDQKFFIFKRNINVKKSNERKR